MTLTVRCHPAVSRLLAPIARDIRAKRASSPARLTGAHEDRIMKLNQERPHSRRFKVPKGVTPGSTVSVAMTSSAAIDAGCCHRARRRQACVRFAHRLRRP
jgi:hypothetical protein